MDSVTWPSSPPPYFVQYYAIAKETEACPELAEGEDVSNALKRYELFVMLQNRLVPRCTYERFPVLWQFLEPLFPRHPSPGIETCCWFHRLM